jgi:hypothetical protein
MHQGLAVWHMLVLDERVKERRGGEEEQLGWEVGCYTSVQVVTFPSFLPSFFPSFPPSLLPSLSFS